MRCVGVVRSRAPTALAAQGHRVVRTACPRDQTRANYAKAQEDVSSIVCVLKAVDLNAAYGGVLGEAQQL